MRVLLLTVLLVTLLLIVEAGRGDAAKEKAGDVDKDAAKAKFASMSDEEKAAYQAKAAGHPLTRKQKLLLRALKSKKGM